VPLLLAHQVNSLHIVLGQMIFLGFTYWLHYNWQSEHDVLMFHRELIKKTMM
jgi:hypothetical protein